MTGSPNPKPTEGLKGRDTGDEFVFHDPDKDLVHILNGTAREIFLLCDGSRSEADIAAVLVERYRIDESTALEDARQTLSQLYSLGVLGE